MVPFGGNINIYKCHNYAFFVLALAVSELIISPIFYVKNEGQGRSCCNVMANFEHENEGVKVTEYSIHNGAIRWWMSTSLNVIFIFIFDTTYVYESNT